VKRRPGGPLALRTAKACGPVPPTLGSSLPCDHAGGRRRLKSPVLRGERAIGRKHHRAGNAGLSRLPCCCRREQSALFFARRARGCGQHPAFPAPSGFLEGRLTQHPGGTCRGNAEVCLLSVVIASEAKQSRLPSRRQSGLLRRGACHRAGQKAGPVGSSQ